MGIWAIPNTVKKAERLQALMNDDLPREQASTGLYLLVGDDRLFDDIKEYEPNDDIRFNVAYRLNDILKMPEDRFLVTWEPEARKICEGIVAKYNLND